MRKENNDVASALHVYVDPKQNEIVELGDIRRQ